MIGYGNENTLNQLPPEEREKALAQQPVYSEGEYDDDFMTQLDNMSASDFLELLKNAGSDLKAKVISMINAGTDNARDYLSNRYNE